MVSAFSFQSYGVNAGNALCLLMVFQNDHSNAGSPMKIRSIAVSLAFLGVAACNAFSRGSGTPNQGEQTVAQVANQGFLDMTVYPVRNSAQRVRLGIATGNRKTALPIPTHLANGLTPRSSVADPIGGAS